MEKYKTALKIRTRRPGKLLITKVFVLDIVINSAPDKFRWKRAMLQRCGCFSKISELSTLLKFSYNSLYVIYLKLKWFYKKFKIDKTWSVINFSKWHFRRH